MFPYEVRKNVFDPELLQAVISDRPARSEDWQHFNNGPLEGGKWAKADNLPASAMKLAGQMAELGKVWGQELFGADDLIGSVYGGGYHSIEPGGVLGIHTDFNRAGGKYRRANMLCYLNENWADEGGCLELHDDDGLFAEIVPELGTVALMESSGRAWHGHPKPAKRWRHSFAIYLFSDSPQEGATTMDKSTVFRDA